MLAFLAGLIVLTLVEIYVMIQVGSAIGALNAIGLLLIVSIFGLWLTKHAGFSVLNRMRMQVETGKMPTNEIIDGVLVLAAGLLLVFPGFVSDVVGLFLLFPPTRGVVRGVVKRRLSIRVSTLEIRRGPDDVIDV